MTQRDLQDPNNAEHDLTHVIGEAEAAGLRPIVRRLNRLIASPTRNVFRLDRDVWTLAWDGLEVRTPDAKGLRDLHTPVSNPSTEITAIALATQGAGSSSGLARTRSTSETHLPATTRRARRGDRSGDGPERRRPCRRARSRTKRAARRAAQSRRARRTRPSPQRRKRKDAQDRHRSYPRHAALSSTTAVQHLPPPARVDTHGTGTRCSYTPAQPVAWELY